MPSGSLERTCIQNTRMVLKNSHTVVRLSSTVSVWIMIEDYEYKTNEVIDVAVVKSVNSWNFVVELLHTQLP